MIKYVVPSYGRANAITTLKYIKKAVVYVSPKEYEEYIKNNPKECDRIIACPDGVQGYGKAKVENWMLDTLFDEDTDGVLIIDDDVACLCGHGINGEANYNVDESLFYELCEDYNNLAKEWGCAMWSFGLNSDRFSYREFAPFSTLSYLDGGLQGFCKKDDLRYDEKLTVKEDVDMFLQQIYKHHKALRVNKYYLNKMSFKGEGGSQAFRSAKKEKEQFVMMQEKWGKDIVRPNRPKAMNKGGGIREYGGAIKINLPISGI